MIESMKYVKNPNVHFHIIGMGPLTDNLISLIKENNLEDKITYYGPIPSKEARPYFKGADVLYVSLSKEGYVGKTIPNKLMMSMAYAKPILAVLSGDGKDVVLESKGGEIASEDPIDIASKIDYMASLNKEELKKLGQINQVYYQSNFSLKRVGELIDSCLKEF
jgi:glycosyltransferase involved in cell wall biosynthesis